MPSPRRRFARRLLVAVLILLVAVGGAATFVLLHAPKNVSHPSVSFTAPTSTLVAPPVPAAKPFVWPIFGYDAGRTRDFTAHADVQPPLHVGWKFGGNALLEFPPVIDGNTIYFEDDGATAKAVSITTGRQLWATHLGTLSAASPAIATTPGLLLVPTLSDSGNSPGNGRIAALSTATGRVVWSRSLPAGSESSPIVSGDVVYFGDAGGKLYALDVRNGDVDWTYQASGAIKGGPALVDGVLYFGDYDGRVYAIKAATGRQIWAVSTSGSDFGFGNGNFYSTPAVAFGRVYMGNTDGFVYSFAAATGAVAWATNTGSYVYASPAVADVKGLGPSVFLGSYNGEFYAFNARSGEIEWTHAAGGRISGSATIVNDIVYYSDLATKSTTGLDARTGASVFSFPDGAFTPVVADPDAIFLDGYNVVYELLPDTTATQATVDETG